MSELPANHQYTTLALLLDMNIKKNNLHSRLHEANKQEEFPLQEELHQADL